MRAAAAWGGLALCIGATATGCSGDDACKGRGETCVSISLAGEGVAQADQLQVLVTRKSLSLSPEMRMSKAQDLPFKVAVLWPDGAGTLSIRSFLEGKLNGVTAEIGVELRGGAHERRALTLFPPLPGGADLGGRSDMRPGTDLRQPPDLATPDDLRMPDLSMPDLSTQDLTMVSADMSSADLTMAAGDMTGVDLSSKD